jgi:hypothetical protein
MTITTCRTGAYLSGSIADGEDFFSAVLRESFLRGYERR